MNTEMIIAAGHRDPSDRLKPWFTVAAVLLCIAALSLSGCRTMNPLPLPAFPGAEGAGAWTPGGRGGKVFVVETLADYGKGEAPISGSLRAAIEAPMPRTVVFSVAGTIELKRPLHIRNDQLTIAGQSAPAGGICLKEHEVIIGADDVIIRYIRFRPGPGAGEPIDAMSNTAARRVIIDHCSFSWSVDEVLSLYSRDDSIIADLTVQWCIISESLRRSVHPKGAHGYGGIWGGTGASWHHNLIAHNDSRNPRFARQQQNVDFRNNVIYNWGQNSVYGGEESSVNLVANYYKAGPATRRDRRNRILNPTSDPSNGLGFGSFYVFGNFVEGFPEVSANNWAGGVQPDPGTRVESLRIDSPFSFARIRTDEADDLLERVLADAGATLPRRDAIDSRLVSDVANGAAPHGRNGLIDHPDSVGGWPDLGTPSTEADFPPDADRDGIPDSVEREFGLDPLDPDDSRLITPSGYSWLEIYLNQPAL